MYVIPKTNIRLLKNAPLEASYTNTLYFSSASAQTNYFSGLTKKNLNNYTYQRVNNGQLKVGILADEIYDCNYMMFQNSAYGDKWFYAFITKVEYVSNTCSMITYELDVIQTWFFDFTLGQCFVEREHTLTDNLGDYLLPEPVELGEYAYDDYSEITSALKPMAIVVAVSDTGEETSDGNVYDGVYSGVTYHAFNSDDITSVNGFVSRYLQSPDSIVSMYMCPVIAIAEGVIPDGGMTIESSTSGWSTTITAPKLDEDSPDFDGYIPKNKKLFSYPYYFLHIDNASGQSLELRYEFFSGGQPKLKLDATKSAPVKITCRPVYYKGNSDQELHTEIITLDNYPQCSWNIDAYKVWLSQNIVPMFMKSASSIFQFGLGTINASAGVMSGNIGQAVTGAASAISGAGSLQSQVSQFMHDRYTASIQADLCKGAINNGNINLSHGYQNFYIGRAHIRREYAQAIDDYFTVFGYATKRVKVPNTHSRPHWNYVKTVGCLINGSIPADDERKICAIHDRGITYWKNGSEVGNYTLDNSP